MYSVIANIDSVEGRMRLDSLKIHKDYYPTIDECINTDDETLTKLFNKMNKESVVCLLREVISQHRVAMKENYAIKDIAESVRSINQRMDHNHQDSIVHAIKPVFDESIKSIKKEPESAPPTVGARKIESHNISNCIRIQGVQAVNLSKNENDIKTNTEVGNLLSELGVNAEIVHLRRLGSFEKFKEKSESNSLNIESHATSEKVAPRVVMVEIKNNWDVRLILARAGTAWDTLAKRKIYIRKALTREEIAKENACLKKRRELIAQGVSRQKLKIKNFQLFNGDDLVALIENTN